MNDPHLRQLTHGPKIQQDRRTTTDNEPLTANSRVPQEMMTRMAKPSEDILQNLTTYIEPISNL